MRMTDTHDYGNPQHRIRAKNTFRYRPSLSLVREIKNGPLDSAILLWGIRSGARLELSILEAQPCGSSALQPRILAFFHIASSQVVKAPEDHDGTLQSSQLLFYVYPMPLLFNRLQQPLSDV
jgi:hypothetical protein